MVQSAGDLWELLPHHLVLPRADHCDSLQADEVVGCGPMVSNDSLDGASRRARC